MNKIWILACGLLIICAGAPVLAAPAGKVATRSIAVRPPDFEKVMTLVLARLDVAASLKARQQVEVNERSVTFISRQPLLMFKPLSGPLLTLASNKPINDESLTFIARTQFLVDSPTIEQRIFLSQGKDRDDKARMRLILRHDGEPFQNFVYSGLGIPMQIYDRSGEMFIYGQAVGADGTVDVKEWIYARRPNDPQGSRYRWTIKSEEFYRRLVLASGKDGHVDIQRQVVVQGVDPLDYAKQRHIIEAIHKAAPGKFYISGEDIIGRMPPVFYVDREGRRKSANFVLNGHNELVIEINEPANNYPLLIGPDPLTPGK